MEEINPQKIKQRILALIEFTQDISGLDKDYLTYCVFPDPCGEQNIWAAGEFPWDAVRGLRRRNPNESYWERFDATQMKYGLFSRQQR